MFYKTAKWPGYLCNIEYPGLFGPRTIIEWRCLLAGYVQSTTFFKSRYRRGSKILKSASCSEFDSPFNYADFISLALLKEVSQRLLTVLHCTLSNPIITRVYIRICHYYIFQTGNCYTKSASTLPWQLYFPAAIFIDLKWIVFMQQTHVDTWL